MDRWVRNELKAAYRRDDSLGCREPVIGQVRMITAFVRGLRGYWLGSFGGAGWRRTIRSVSLPESGTLGWDSSIQCFES